MVTLIARSLCATALSFAVCVVAPVEQAHVVAAYRFELSKLTVPAIRTRVVSMLRNVSDDLASQVAAGLGMAFVAVSPLLGTFGTALTGSTTASNALFSARTIRCWAARSP